MEADYSTNYRPVLGLGTWAFGDAYWPGQDIQASKKVLKKAVELGISHIDTAPVYGNGTAEQLIGQTLRKQLRKNRERFVIATKSFYYPRDGLLKRVEKSLRRLQIEWVDIFYIHWPSPGKDMRGMMETLMELKEKGLVKAVGVSNFSVEELQRVMEAGKPEYYQVGYNLVWRKPEADIIPFCREQGIKLITYSSLAQGVLSGKFHFNKNDESFRSTENPDSALAPGCTGRIYSSGQAFDQTAGQAFDQTAGQITGRIGSRVGGRVKTYYFDPNFRKQVENCLEQFCQVLKESGIIGERSHTERKCRRGLIRLALNWLQSVPGIAVVLVGARDPEQLEELAALYNTPLPKAVIDAGTAVSNILHYPPGNSMFRRH